MISLRPVYKRISIVGRTAGGRVAVRLRLDDDGRALLDDDVLIVFVLVV